MTEAFQPIANYGLLADCNSAALVDRADSIDWLCLPRYDSDAESLVAGAAQPRQDAVANRRSTAHVG